MRAAHPTDFTLDVEDIGRFVFGRRQMADEIKIHVEYARLTEAVTPTAWLDQVATWLSTLKVMTVRAPDGWNLDEMDPLDDETYAKMLKVYAALTAKEGSFRRGPAKGGEAAGEAAGRDDRVLVPRALPPDVQ